MFPFLSNVNKLYREIDVRIEHKAKLRGESDRIRPPS